MEGCIGDEAEVLWESSDKNGKMSGYSENYIKVWADYDPSLIGRTSKVVLTRQNTRLDALSHSDED